jgi:hypothetical protein
MLSIKIKKMVYELLPGSTAEERNGLRMVWEEKYKPVCNKELNEIH